ncbi:MAG: hypothetical protein WCI53_09650 [Bacteroidota bacterium]|jgi:hypothetical protein
MKFITNQAKLDASQMTDLFGSGKMDVVVTVIAIIFTILCGYLLMMDLRLRKLENKDKK